MMRTGLVTVIFLALLLVGCVVYPGIGARFIAPQTVLQAFLHFDPQNFDHNVIVRLRLPRLAAALLTGASLGVAGALLQAVIRNPLGEPHILGLNAGAALAVVAASALGLAFPVGRPLLASTGGALLFLLILLLSSAGRSGVTPMKVTLCGVALSAFVSSITAAILILDEQTLLAMRAWLAGDLAGQDWATLGTSAWFSLGGFVLALYLAPSLNMLALGDRMAQGLGVSVLRTRTFTLLAIALLCGAAVSIAGPIAVGILIFGLMQGSFSVPASEVGRALFAPENVSTDARYIVQDIRLPRVIMALLCGAMLGMAGAAMQSIARNGLADPGLIGVKEGCSVAVLWLIFQFPMLGMFWRPVAGLAGGLLVALIVIFCARDISRPRFVLIGIGVSWFFAAGIGVFMTTADVRDVQTALMWLSGSLHAANWMLVGISACWMLPATLLLLFTARTADIALLGHQVATGLGVDSSRLALLRVAAPIILTAVCVSCVGNIGFVGLIAPHISRFILRGGQTTLLLGSAVSGALLVILADSIGRLAFLPLQLPAGIIISLIGGPFFLLLLWQRRNSF